MAGLSKLGLIFTRFHKNWEMHPLNNLEMQTQSSDAYLVPLKPSTMENLTSVGGHLEIFKTCLNCLNSLIRSKHCKSHELNLKSGDSVYLMGGFSKVFVKNDCFLHLRGKTPAHKKHLSVQQRSWKIYFRKKTTACIFCDQGFP